MSDILDKIRAGGKVACFGSRETPANVLEVMTKLAAKIVQLGGVVASGHCYGADLAWEQGAIEAFEKSTIRIPPRMLICLPWARYNWNIPCRAGSIVEVLDLLPDDEKLAILKEAEKHHGAWHRLSHGGKMLHGRNILIGRNSILGLTYLNPKKIGGGGSGQCYRYLKSNNVPVFDLAKKEGLDVLREILTA